MELLVALPLEPTGYPLNNPGDRALLTGLSPSENGERLLWALSRFTGYVGAIGALGPMRGERFAQLNEALSGVQLTLNARGLLYIDPRPGAVRGPDRAWGRGVDLVVDEPATRGEIERKLAALEALAREAGSALGYAGEGSPVVVERIAAWAAGVESRGLVLAPVTAMLRRPETEEVRRGGGSQGESLPTLPPPPYPLPPQTPPLPRSRSSSCASRRSRPSSASGPLHLATQTPPRAPQRA
jgi:polysaccharide deacetylase 2 family uncharacterized protein YibQ